MRLDSLSPPRELSRSVTTPKALSRLQRLQDEHPVHPLSTFASWADACNWLDGIGARNAASDAVLRPVLTEAKRSPDEAWQNLLLWLFWCPLVQIRHALGRLDQDANALDSQVSWAFLHAVHRLDLDQRDAGLGRKILNDVQHDVRLAYAGERARISPLVLLLDESDDADGLGGEIVGAPDSAFGEIDSRLDSMAVRGWLGNLVRRGRLSRPDYQILVGCSLYGLSIEEMAARLKLSCEAARKRRQRATKKLRSIARKMSPGFGLDPL